MTPARLGAWTHSPPMHRLRMTLWLLHRAGQFTALCWMMSSSMMMRRFKHVPRRASTGRPASSTALIHHSGPWHMASAAVRLMGTNSHCSLSCCCGCAINSSLLVLLHAFTMQQLQCLPKCCTGAGCKRGPHRMPFCCLAVMQG